MHFAANALGTMFREGNGVAQDYGRALELYKAAAASELHLAEANIATMYADGLGVAQDGSEAARWYNRAADHGNLWAQNQLADLYQSGRGVEQNHRRAFELFSDAARRGSPVAKASVGQAYENGWGVDQSLSEAARWYEIAADHENAWAENRLGYSYRTGRGVPQDYARALDLYRRGAAHGSSEAEANVGYMYAHGYSVVQSLPEAARWYEVAAGHGNAWAQNELGDLYQNGKGVDQDRVRAFGLYRAAANRGSAVAQANVGEAYENGWGIDQDLSEAIRWYRTAVDHGNAWAENRLGYLYQIGKGTSQDYGIALEHYRRAAARGSTAAEANLGYMYANGLGVERDDRVALQHLVAAGNSNNTYAMWQAGEFYNYGRGSVQDDLKAYVWYRLAVDAGSKDAIIPLAELSIKGLQRLGDTAKILDAAEKRGQRVFWARGRESLFLSFDRRLSKLRDARKRYSELEDDERMAFMNEQVADFAISRLTTDPLFAAHLEIASRGLRLTKNDGLREAETLLRKLIDEGTPAAALLLGNLNIKQDEYTGANLDYYPTRFGKAAPLSESNVWSAASAVKMYQLAASQDSNAARINLAGLYELGWGISKNVDKASELYRAALGTSKDGQARLGLVRASLASTYERQVAEWRRIGTGTDDQAPRWDSDDILIEATQNYSNVLVTDSVGRRIFTGNLKQGQIYSLKDARNDLILWGRYGLRNIRIHHKGHVEELPSKYGIDGFRLNREKIDQGIDCRITSSKFENYLPDETIASSRMSIKALSNANVYVHDKIDLIGFEREMLPVSEPLVVPDVTNLTLTVWPSEKTEATGSTVRLLLDGDDTLELLVPPKCRIDVELEPDRLKTANK
jgi:TPR repeat protein